MHRHETTTATHISDRFFNQNQLFPYSNTLNNSIKNNVFHRTDLTYREYLIVSYRTNHRTTEWFVVSKCTCATTCIFSQNQTELIENQIDM